MLLFHLAITAFMCQIGAISQGAHRVASLFECTQDMTMAVEKQREHTLRYVHCSQQQNVALTVLLFNEMGATKKRESET